MKKRRSVGGGPYAPRKKKAITVGGGAKDDTCDHGLYVPKLEGGSVPKQKKNH